MSEVIGQNTPNAEKLRGYVDELERLASQKKDIGEQEKAVKAAASASGFNVQHGINYVLKARRMKPHDRQEAEITRDIYLHAMGMLPELPLFRQLTTMVNDKASESQVLDALKQLAPAKGDIIMRMGGKSFRIFRDRNGLAKVEDHVAQEPSERTTARAEPDAKRSAPDCSPEEAFALGEQAAKDNQAVISNPFPYGDARRPRWDEGWRKGAGGDGMGG